jgi:hypothetical protein
MVGLFTHEILNDGSEDDADPLPAGVRKLTGFELLAQRQKVRPLVCRACGEPIAPGKHPRGFICGPCITKQKKQSPEKQRARNARYRANLLRRQTEV